MVHTMLFTDMPFNTPGAGGAHVGVPSAGWLEMAVTVPIVKLSRLGDGETHSSDHR